MGTHALDLTGQRFGKLIAIKIIERDKNRQIVWLCKCDCGKDHKVTATGLRAGRVGHGKGVKSCGCYRDTFKLLPGDEGSFNAWFNAYRYNSNYHSRKKKEFSLTKNEFRLITNKNCIYCGSEPKPYYAKNRKAVSPVPYFCNGIDRINNEVGYTFSNCVPCCSLCNYMKRGLSFFDFMNHIHKISSYPGAK